MSDITILPRDCRATVLRDGDTYTFKYRVFPRGVLRFAFKKEIYTWLRIENKGGNLHVDPGCHYDKEG
jgi:hypothetical protein